MKGAPRLGPSVVFGSGRPKHGDGRDEPGHREVTAQLELRFGPKSCPEPR
jgi:hypothetical protein